MHGAHMKHTIHFLFGLILSVMLAGCGGGGGETTSASTTATIPTKASVTLDSIAITPATANVSKGLSASFTAIATYSDGNTADVTSQVTWASANITIASIDSATGVATGVAVGSTTVTATANGITSPAASLTVTAATIASISITPTVPSTPKGRPVTFSATGTYSDGTTGNVSGSVTWISSNTAIASLNGSGIASSLGQGTTTVTAVANGVTSNAATLTVTAPLLTAIAVNPSISSVAQGLTTAFTATGTYTDATTADLTSQVTWASANGSIATINNTTGVATGVAVGNTTVTGSLSGITSNSAALTVNNAVITGISISPTTPSTPKGTPVTFTATATYSNGATGNASGSVIWASSDTAVATLNTTGVASSLAQGSTTIFASANGITSNSAILTVTAPVLTAVAITPTTANLTVGSTQQLIATGTYTDGLTAEISSSVVWTLSNSAVASVGSTGLVSALSTGSSNISASSGGITSNAVVLKVALGTQMGGARQGMSLNLTAAVTTFAGSGVAGSADGTGVLASFSNPMGMTTDGINLYVADAANNRVRKVVIATGVVTTLAGSGAYGSVDGTGTAASFSTPEGITTDGTYLYVADTWGYRIRKIEIATGVVTTLAGSGASGSADGTGTAASFFFHSGITTDGANLYVSDGGNNKIRKIVIATGVVTTLAGSGVAARVDGVGTAASFSNPKGITTDGTNLYVADYGSSSLSIRKIVIATGMVTTLNNNLGQPFAITTDGINNLYLTAGNLILKVDIATGVGTTLAGTGATGSVDATGMAASFSFPRGITTDGVSLYVSDGSNSKIRKIQ